MLIITFWVATGGRAIQEQPETSSFALPPHDGFAPTVRNRYLVSGHIGYRTDSQKLAQLRRSNQRPLSGGWCRSQERRPC